MRKVEQKTVDNAQRFLKIVQDSVGKELDLQKITQTFHLQNSTAAYARKMGLIDYEGKKILKVHYTKAEPIVARRLIDFMNKIKKENDAKRKLAKERGEEPKPPTIEDVIQEIEGKGVVPNEEVKKTYKKKEEKPVVVSEAPTEELKPRPRRKYTIRIFGIPVITKTVE